MVISVCCPPPPQLDPHNIICVFCLQYRAISSLNNVCCKNMLKTLIIEFWYFQRAPLHVHQREKNEVPSFDAVIQNQVEMNSHFHYRLSSADSAILFTIH